VAEQLTCCIWSKDYLIMLHQPQTLLGAKLYKKTVTFSELERIMEDEVGGYYKVLSQHSAGGTKQNHTHKEMFRIVCVLAKI
jgi:hypothetical protein